MSIYAKTLTLIGTVWLSRFLLNTARFIWIYTRPSSLPRYHHRRKHDSSPPWAIITGASDGIGKSYALELASHSFNLVLHGRNASKLASVSDALEKEYPDIKVVVVVSDACKSGCESMKEISCIIEKIRDLHITILINNVGTGTRPTGHVFSTFQRDIPSDIDAMINTNARFTAQFTRAVLPLLLKHAYPSLILTMGSISDVGSPFLSVYSAAKAFDTSFSRSLTREMRAEGRDVEVLAIMTAQVTDTATACAPVSVLRPSAREYAKSALERVGCGYDVVEGWWSHAILRGVLVRLPDAVFSGMLVESIREEMKIEGKSA